MTKKVWLTFSLPYEGHSKSKFQRFAVEMMGEHFAKCSWINNFGLDTKINHCGRFGKNTVVINTDGFVVKNEHLLTSKTLITFHQTLLAGIQMGKEKMTVR